MFPRLSELTTTAQHVTEDKGGMYDVTDENDPRSEVYFSGTKAECEAWIDENEGNSQYKGCEFSAIRSLGESPKAVATWLA